MCWVKVEECDNVFEPKGVGVEWFCRLQPFHTSKRQVAPGDNYLKGRLALFADYLEPAASFNFFRGTRFVGYNAQGLQWKFFLTLICLRVRCAEEMMRIIVYGYLRGTSDQYQVWFRGKSFATVL